jgi:hypothetical protein
MHELITHDWLDHDYIERHVDGWPALRERALQWPPERAAAVCGIRPTKCASWRATTASTAPAAIRLNYGMQRVHGGGNAVRLIALLPCLVGAWRHRAGGLLLSSSGWFRPRATTPGCSGPTCWPAASRAPSTWCTIGDDLLRELAPAFGPRVEALVVYNSNPVAVAPDSARWSRLRARGPVHRGAGALPHRHRRPRRLRAAGHHAAGALGRAHHLRPHLRAAQRAGHRAAGAGAVQCRRSFARWRRAWASTSPVLPTATSHGAAGLRARTSTSSALRRAAGAAAGAERPLPTAVSPPHGKAMADAPGLGVPDFVPNHDARRPRPTGRALPAGHDLAAGAALPQQQLRQRGQPARDRARAAGGDPPRGRRARGIAAAPRCGLQRPRPLPLQGRASASARGPAWSTAWASGGASSAWTAPTSTS